MKRIDILVRKIDRLDQEISLSISQANNILTEKLGEGWGVTQQTDGLCIVGEDEETIGFPINTCVSKLEVSLGELLELPREEAIEIIERASA